MKQEPGTWDGTLAADGYRNLLDLFGLGVAHVNVVGGLLQAQTNGATVRIVPRGSPKPSDADAGTTLAAGAGIGFQESDFIRLDEIWVRNTTAASNARLVFTGTLETV